MPTPTWYNPLVQLSFHQDFESCWDYYYTTSLFWMGQIWCHCCYVADAATGVNTIQVQDEAEPPESRHSEKSPVFGCVKAKLELFTDLLKVASLQGLVPHLTEIHTAIVMAQFPLQHTEKTHKVQPGGMDVYACVDLLHLECQNPHSTNKVWSSQLQMKVKTWL